MDSIILLSLVNTKLRDEFESLDDLVSFYGIDKAELEKKLKAVDFEYNKDKNQFR